ncbi:hypothetical protein [Microlunatus ginsengisoli]
MSAMSGMGDEMTSRNPEESKSLDLVQRVIISVFVGVVVGLFAGVLAVYIATGGQTDLARSDVVGLWIMTGVLGLITSGAILMVNRRRPYHPAVLLGLLPMAAAAYWIF